MKISGMEQRAIRCAIDFGEKFGFGNLIAHLTTAWCRRLIAQGLPLDAARAASGHDKRGYPFGMQDDLVERGQWDETGDRYEGDPARELVREPRGVSPETDLGIILTVHGVSRGKSVPPETVRRRPPKVGRPRR